MKEMIKSKGMVAFIIFILGVSYLNAMGFQNLEQTEDKDTMIVLNER